METEERIKSYPDILFVNNVQPLNQIQTLRLHIYQGIGQYSDKYSTKSTKTTFRLFGLR